MHRAIGFISKRLIQVRAGEGRKVLLTALYFFLVITAYYVIKPASRSLVLGDLGSRLVPYVDLISAILMGPIVTLFARLVDRMPKRRLVSLAFWAVAASLVVFWKLLQWPSKWVAAAFYVWVAIFSVLVVTLFWLVANDLYHPREAKRLFGLIGSGGILGGIVGSSIAAAGASVVGTERLLLLSAAILLVCWVLVQRLWRYAPSTLTAENPSASPPADPMNLRGVVRSIFQSRYLVLLVGLVGIAKIVSTLVYYQFNPFIEQMFPDQDAKTAFTGLFFGWVNLAAFLIQFLLTSWILRHVGLAWALLVLPAGLLAGSVGLVLLPTFWLAATMELYDGSMNYSLQQTTKEVLYLPIDRSVRYKVKPFIDMIVFRFGKGIAALVGILCLDVLHLEARALSYLSIPLVCLWGALAIQLRRDYVKTIRAILQARATARRSRESEAAIRHQECLPAVAGSDALEERLDSLLPGSPAHQKLVLASRLFAINGTLAEESERLLSELTQYEQRPHASDQDGLQGSLEQLKACLQDRHQAMSTRRAAIKRVVQHDGQEAIDCLLGMLMVEDDEVMRQEVLRGLTKLRLRHPRGVEFPKPLIQRQVAKEVHTYQRITQVAAIYRLAATWTPGNGTGPAAFSVSLSNADPIWGLLRVLLEETTQQIFRLLSLLYRPQDLYLIYNQLREPDAYVRADAIELLDNLIDPGLRRLIFPVLDEDRFLDHADAQSQRPLDTPQETYRLLQEGIWDHNRWLSVVIVYVVGRLRLESLFAELDRAGQSQTPLLATAARAARRLAAGPIPPRC